MRHSKELLEAKYAKPDPWGYRTHPDDAARRQAILDACVPARRALDIGAGEGWITGDLPADEIHAIEISDNAAARFPENVTRVNEPIGTYDLIVATGVLYETYDVQTFLRWINGHAVGRVVTCHIKPHEVRGVEGREIYAKVFSYRSKMEVLRVFEFRRRVP